MRLSWLWLEAACARRSASLHLEENAATKIPRHTSTSNRFFMNSWQQKNLARGESCESLAPINSWPTSCWISWVDAGQMWKLQLLISLLLAQFSMGQTVKHRKPRWCNDKNDPGLWVQSWCTASKASWFNHVKSPLKNRSKNCMPNMVENGRKWSKYLMKQEAYRYI